MSKKRTMTKTQYAFWLAAAKERYGQNMLDWPRNIREHHNSMRIEEDKPQRKQLRLPYSNTGVEKGAYK